MQLPTSALGHSSNTLTVPIRKHCKCIRDGLFVGRLNQVSTCLDMRAEFLVGRHSVFSEKIVDPIRPDPLSISSERKGTTFRGSGPADQSCDQRCGVPLPASEEPENALPLDKIVYMSSTFREVRSTRFVDAVKQTSKVHDGIDRARGRPFTGR